MLLAGVLSACINAQAGNCQIISNTFFVGHWQGPSPTSVDLKVIKSGMERATSIKYDAEVLGRDDQPAGRVLRLTAQPPADPRLLAADTYDIVIDGTLRYHVHDIKLLDDDARGCLVQSAKVDACQLNASRFISFDAGCRLTAP